MNYGFTHTTLTPDLIWTKIKEKQTNKRTSEKKSASQHKHSHQQFPIPKSNICDLKKRKKKHGSGNIDGKKILYTQKQKKSIQKLTKNIDKRKKLVTSSIKFPSPSCDIDIGLITSCKWSQRWLVHKPPLSIRRKCIDLCANWSIQWSRRLLSTDSSSYWLSSTNQKTWRWLPRLPSAPLCLISG